MEQNDLPGFFATLHAKMIEEVPTSLSWDIVFEPSVSYSTIMQRKTHIELAMNNYLERHIDAIANELVVPFTNTMEVTDDPMTYTFNIKVFRKSRFKRKISFPYPPDPVKNINGFVLVIVPPPHPPHPGGSHVNTVAIKPPPN